MGNWFTRDNFIFNTYDIAQNEEIPKDGEYDDINNISCQYALFDNSVNSDKLSLDVYYKYSDTTIDPMLNSREKSIKSFMKEMKNIEVFNQYVDLKVNILDESENIPINNGSMINYADLEVITKIKYGINNEKPIYDLYFKCTEADPEIKLCKVLKETIESDLRDMLRNIEK